MSWQEEYLETLIPICRESEDYIGIAALGSWAYGDSDEYSDFDLLIVHSGLDDKFPGSLEEIAHQCGDLIACYGGEHIGKSFMRICLYDNPLRRVDLTMVALPAYIDDQVQIPLILDDPRLTLHKSEGMIDGRYPEVDFQYIEDRFWVWIINAAQKVRRGDVFEAINYITTIRRNALLKMIHAVNGSEPRGYRSLHTIAPEWEKQLHKTHPGSLNKTNLVSALESTIAVYLGLRTKSNCTIKQNQRSRKAAEELLGKLK